MPIAPKTRGYVYFAGMPDDLDTVKIGFTRDIAGRLTTLSTGSPKKLVLHQYFATAAESEKLVHKRFAKDRIRGEWFNLTFEVEDLWDDILDYQMMSVRASEDDPDEIFIDPKHVALMLTSIGEKWPAEIAAMWAI